jgi:ornithine cyclodeaminase/alanine dehydrogenase-like protein (mu-crystallin family)
MHWINSMPAFLEYENIVGIKWVNVTSENSKRGLPVTMGVIILNDATTGMPIAIMDGTWITHMRTAASTAIGAKLFARKSSKVITVVGCGAEGKTNLQALTRFFDFEEVRVVDINKNVRTDFAESMARRFNLTILAFDTVKEAARDSDIVLLATTARKPLMLAEWAKPGDYITSIAAFADLDPAFIHTADKIYMDDKNCAMIRVRTVAGLEINERDIFGDICEVMAAKKAKRENDKEIIVYIPVGMGAVDVGVAYEALTLAAAKNIGGRMELYESL